MRPLVKFGNIICETIHGSPNYAQEETESWTIAGRDGVGVRAIGKRVRETSLELVIIGTAWFANNADVKIKASAGSMVWVNDDFGRHYRIYVLRSDPPEIKAAYIPGTNTEVIMRIKVIGMVTN